MNDKDKKCEWRLSRKKGKKLLGPLSLIFIFAQTEGKELQQSSRV
jgi:hypothetical protein